MVRVMLLGMVLGFDYDIFGIGFKHGSLDRITTVPTH